MKRFFKTRLAIIVITVLVCILAFGGIAYAAGTFNKDIPTTMSIKATNPNIGLFSDAIYSIPASAISFGNINSGTIATKTIYIKNIGNKDFSSINVSSNLDPALGTITGTIPPLAVGVGVAVTLTLTTPELLVDANPSVTITLTGSY